MTDVRLLIQEQVRSALRTYPANGGPMTANEIFKHVDCANDVAEVAEALRSLQVAGIATKAGAYGWRLCGTVAPPMCEAPVAAVAEPVSTASTPPAGPPSAMMTAKEALIAFGRGRENFSVKEALTALGQYKEMTLRWHVKDLLEKGVLERIAIGLYRVLDAERIGEQLAAQADSVTCSTGNDDAQIEGPVEAASSCEQKATVAALLETERDARVESEAPLALSLRPSASNPKLYELNARNCRGAYVTGTGPLEVMRSLTWALMQDYT